MESDSSKTMTIIKHYNHCEQSLKDWKHISLESSEMD